MANKKIAHFDFDSVRFPVASACEKREVIVTHKASGRTKIVKNVTEFYGRGKNKDGGILAEINKGRDSPFTYDEFEYEPIQTAEPAHHAFYSCKSLVNKIIKASGADDVKFYIGGGESFRVGHSTLMKYKGNRDNTLMPLLFEELTEYMIKKYKPEIVTHFEADDRVVQESYGKKNHFIIGVDKDFYGTGSSFFNYNYPDEGVVDTTGLGSLYLLNGKVRGTGTLFKLWQVCSGDKVDNYKANCFSEVPWADRGAYKALEGSKTFKEAFERSVSIFKMLYPQPKTVVGWKGDNIDIDWLYVMQECFDMAHMQRWEEDFVDLNSLFDKLKIDTEEIAPYVV